MIFRYGYLNSADDWAGEKQKKNILKTLVNFNSQDFFKQTLTSQCSHSGETEDGEFWVKYPISLTWVETEIPGIGRNLICLLNLYIFSRSPAHYRQHKLNNAETALPALLFLWKLCLLIRHCQNSGSLILFFYHFQTLSIHSVTESNKETHPVAVACMHWKTRKCFMTSCCFIS